MKSSRNTKLTLYKKEQLMLCILLFSFVLSGFCLPRVKEKLASPPDSLEQVIVIDDSDEVKEPIDEEVIMEVPEEVVENPEEDLVEDIENEVTVPEPEPNETPKDIKPSKQPENPAPSPEPETQTPSVPEKEPEKIWVPPVYKTVHHEAIYETVRIVICNYCSEEFGSIGEFQVHKDANGGWAGLHTTCRAASKEILVQEAWDEEILISEGYYQ